MDADQMFQKALLLLDNSRLQEGEAVLREVITGAKLERDAYTLGRSLACLGDLLFESGRQDDARQVLAEFRRERFPDDDVLDFERKRVEELMAALAE